MNTSVGSESEGRSFLRALGIFFGIVFVPILAISAFQRRGFSPLANRLAICWTVIWAMALVGNVVPRTQKADLAPTVAEAKESGKIAAPVSPLVDPKWGHYRNGRYVKCSITNGLQWYILMPTEIEMRAGIGPRVNQTPSLSVWEEFCG